MFIWMLCCVSNLICVLEKLPLGCTIYLLDTERTMNKNIYNINVPLIYMLIVIR